MDYFSRAGRFIFEAMKMFKKIKSKDAKINNPYLYIERPNDYKSFQNEDFGLMKVKNIIVNFYQAASTSRLLKFPVYVTAVCVMVVLLWGSVSAVDLQFAKQAVVNGKPVGIVTDTKHFETVLTGVENDLSDILKTNVKKTQPIYVTRLVFGIDVSNDTELKQNILSTFDQVEKAYVVFVDGKAIAASRDQAAVDRALSDLKAKYAKIDGDAKDVTTAFTQKIEVRETYVPTAMLKSPLGIYYAVSAKKTVKENYTVTESDTLTSLAQNYGMTEDELIVLNNGKNNFAPGDVIAVNVQKPIISVRTTYALATDVDVDPKTVEVDDNTMLKGTSKVVTQGESGKKKVIENIVALNGVVIDKNVASEKVTKGAVDEKVAVGSKVLDGKGTGSYIRPSFGVITSRFGMRSRGMHTGIDIASKIGTPISAADNGKVVFAGWSGNYGNCIKISHGNGVETLYGHCNELEVAEGDIVEKGQQIAKVGSTGNSTGPHLHFEVRINGQPANPEQYVSLTK